MTFQRLDDDTVRCILSEEDMQEHDLKLEDFFTNKDKARNFLEDVVRQAKEEIGYETKGDTFAMQVMPLSKNRLSITFTERSENALQNMLGHIKSAIGGMEDEEMNDIMEHMCKNVMEKAEDVLKNSNILDDTDNKPEKKRAKKEFYRVYCFKKLEDVEQFCGGIPENYIVKSQLYKDEKMDAYYLSIEKGRVSMKNIEKICLRAEEFATLVSTQSSYIEFCREHYKMIIKKNAVKVIRNIAVNSIS